VALLLINASVWLVVLQALYGGEIWLLFAGWLLETGAVIAFSLHLWRRIIPRIQLPTLR
jgi:hypothetical protein